MTDEAIRTSKDLNRPSRHCRILEIILELGLGDM
jgi:hypothetical protein